MNGIVVNDTFNDLSGNALALTQNHCLSAQILALLKGPYYLAKHILYSNLSSMHKPIMLVRYQIRRQLQQQRLQAIRLLMYQTMVMTQMKR